jgi:ribosomal protein S12 methylthiotransferase accessory factor
MLERAFPGDEVRFSYVGAYTLSGHAPNLRSLAEDVRDNCSGKGASDPQARASALCEALEGHSFLFHGDEPRRLAPMKLLGDSAIHPNACMLFSEQQYRHREAWGVRGSSYYVPLPFDEEAAVEWSPVWSLTRQESRYLPTASCYYRYPDPIQGSTCLITSNGNAGGNTLEEAILHGFFEVVERDAVGIWWHNRVRRPGVDLRCFGEPYLTGLQRFLHDRHRDFWAIDLTSDLGIPVFAALSRRVDQHPERITLGFGAHLNPVVALLRAAAELSQMLTIILPDEEGQCAELPEIVRGVPMARSSHPFLDPDPDVPARRPSDYRQAWSDDLKEDVLACQRLVETRGMELLVLDVTRADIGLPVVKVIVPGLRSFFPRYAPVRLFDVPVQSGWLREPLGEDQFNPESLFP